MDELISKTEALSSIKALYPNTPPIIDIFGARRKWIEKYAPYFECENAIEQLQPKQGHIGHWVEETVKHGRRVFCSECGGSPTFEYVSDGDVYSSSGYGVINKISFCPDCGARMFESKEESEVKV